MKFFPDFFLKNRYLNKAYRIFVVIYRNLLELSVADSRVTLEKLGSNYGGWFVPTLQIRSDWIIYSGGIGQDTTFDEELIRRYGCKVFAFDPTPTAIEFVNQRKKNSEAMKNFVFSPIGLWSQDTILKFYAPRTRGWVGSYSARNLQGMEEYFEAQCKSITTIMREYGHQKINLLKIDIEGAEYEVLDDIITNRVEVDWLCVEFDQPVPFWTTQRMLSKLFDYGLTLQKIDKWNFTFAHISLLKTKSDPGILSSAS